MNTPRSDALERLVNYWQTLTPASVPAIDAVYAAEARFRDPFNDARGLADIRRVFAEMFVRLDEPRFTVIETIEQPHGAVMIWNFDFRIKSLKPAMARRIHGTSHVRFGDDGRVLYHRDYWDAAEELYEKLPMVGALMRWLKRKMA
jgi:steroid delta-isomerase